MNMSLAKSKNLERKLNLIFKEASTELNNVCGSNLWETLGFVYFEKEKKFLLGFSEHDSNHDYYFIEKNTIEGMMYS